MTFDYQYTPVPTKLMYCMDVNCRSTFFALLQLSTYFSNKENNNKDGWFFRTNARLEEDTNLSKNPLKGALHALFQKDIIDIKPEAKGKGRNQSACHYKINFKKFLDYDKLSLDECSPDGDMGIRTSNYKKKLSFRKQLPNKQPMTQQEQQPKEQPNQLPQRLPVELPKQRKSDNNINNIDKIDNLNNKNKIDNINNTCNNVIINNNDIVVTKDDFISSLDSSDDYFDSYSKDRDFYNKGLREEPRNEGKEIPREDGSLKDSESKYNSNSEEVKVNQGTDKAVSPDKSNGTEMGTPASKGACEKGESESSAAARRRQFSEQEIAEMKHTITDRMKEIVDSELGVTFLYNDEYFKCKNEVISCLMNIYQIDRAEALKKFEGVKDYFEKYLRNQYQMY